VRLQRGLVIRRLAPAALMPAGAFAVHQLRYWLAYGNHAGVELAEQGHSYLHSVVPWIVLLIGMSVGTFVLALGRALGGRRSMPRYPLSFAALWLLCAACLVAIYTTQEFLEGLVSPNKAAAPDSFALRITKGGQPVRGANVTLLFNHLEMEMPTQEYQLTETQPGVYSRAAPALVMVGRWGLTFQVTPKHGLPFTALIVDQADG